MGILLVGFLLGTHYFTYIMVWLTTPGLYGKPNLIEQLSQNGMEKYQDHTGIGTQPIPWILETFVIIIPIRNQSKEKVINLLNYLTLI